MPKANPDELYPILEALKPLLKSIDVRTVAVSLDPDKPWQNLITSVCVSPKEEKEIKSELQALPPYPKINNNFAIFAGVYPFDYTVFGQIAEGVMRFYTQFGRNVVKCRNFDPLSLKVNSSEEKVGGSYEYVWRAAGSGDVEERKALWSVVNAERIPPQQLDYPNIVELIKDFLKIPNFNFNDSKDFELRIYNLARIEQATFSDSTFRVKIKKFCGLKGLQLNLRRGTRGYPLPGYNKRKEITQEETRIDNNFCSVSETFDVSGLLSLDWVATKLIHKDSALIWDEKDERVPLKNPIEPFARTLNAFCTIEEFNKMLSERVLEYSKPSVVFERAVAWLLSLIGFSTIVLASKTIKAFDHLKLGDIQIGCADILAYKKNDCLLLVDCTIRTPDDKKIQDLKDAQKHISSILASHTGLRIVPVIFSPADCGHLKTDIEVRIIDKYQMEQILENVAKGKVEEVQHIF